MSWFAFFLFSLPASAQYAQIDFRSSADQFSLIQSGSNYLLDTQRVDLGVFKNFLPLFKEDLGDPCPDLPKQADLRVTAHTASQERVTRHFYIEQKTISDGTHCAFVTGDGVYYIPLSKQWYIGPSHLTIPSDSPLRLENKNQYNISMIYRDQEWFVPKNEFFLDWDFINRFLDSLTNFPIQSRLHPAIARNKPHFLLISDNKQYNFYKVAPNLWAVQMPGQSWLNTSAGWSFWQDMEPALILDRHTDLLRQFIDKKLPTPQRISLLETLTPSWNRSIKLAVHQVLLDPTSEEALLQESVRKIRQKPSLDSMGVLIELLQAPATSDHLAQLITETLRVRHRSGPLFKPEDSKSTRSRVIQEWKQWWKNQK